MILSTKRGFKTKARVCSTPFEQARGLMFSKRLEKGHSVLLDFSREKNIPIHMFFVFQSIDAIWLDENFRINHIERNIKPFTPYINPNKKSVAVLETRANASKKLRVGDKLLTKSL